MSGRVRPPARRRRRVEGVGFGRREEANTSVPVRAPSPAGSRRKSAGYAFLASDADPSEDNIREAIAGNLCRCTGYTKIIDAIAAAATGRT